MNGILQAQKRLIQSKPMRTSTLDMAQVFPYLAQVDGILDQCGLANLAYANNIQVYTMLLIALIERWDLDYYTFHLPIGEMMVSIKDIYHM